MPHIHILLEQKPSLRCGAHRNRKNQKSQHYLRQPTHNANTYRKAHRTKKENTINIKVDNIEPSRQKLFLYTPMHTHTHTHYTRRHNTQFFRPFTYVVVLLVCTFRYTIRLSVLLGQSKYYVRKVCN